MQTFIFETTSEGISGKEGEKERKTNWREKTQKGGDVANPRERKEMEHEGMKQVYRERERKQGTWREMRCRRNGRTNGATQEEEKGGFSRAGGGGVLRGGQKQI